MTLGQAHHETLLFPPKFSMKHEFSSLLAPAKMKGSSYPVPVFTVDYQKKVFDFDPIFTKIEEKEAMEFEKRKKLTILRKDHEKVPSGYVSSEFRKYAIWKYNDTDPFASHRIHYIFDCRHHGGNLSSVKIDKELHLVQVNNNDELPLTIINPAKFDSVARTWNEDLWRNEFVYEVKKHKDLFAMRKRSSLSVVNVFDQFKVTKHESNHDILSFAMMKNDIFYIDSLKKLRQFNFVSEIAVKLENVEIKGFSPTLDTFDKNSLSFTDAQNMAIIDIRSNTKTDIFTSKNFSTECDEIFNHKKSVVNDQLIYIGSNHVMYLSDVRMPGKCLMQCVHQLSRPPLMMKCVKTNDNNEVICVSSNIPHDVKLFNYLHDEQRIDLLPIQPKSMHKSMNEMFVRGKLLLEEHLKKRIHISISGIEVNFNKKDTVELFVQTSIGDIFKSSIFLTEEFQEKSEKFEEEFMKWNKVLQLQKPNVRELKLNFTSVNNLRGVKRAMLESRESSSDEDDTVMHEKKIPSWKVSMEDAQSYHDVLAQHLLAAWEIDDDDEKVGLDGLLENDDMKAEDKVQNWLKSQYNPGTDELDQDAESQIIKTETQSTVIVTQTNTPAKPKRIKGF